MPGGDDGEARVLERLARAGAVLRGHFLLSSGRHSDTYVEKFRLLEDPRATAELAESLAARLSPKRVDVVLSPAIGGIVLGFATALALGTRFIFAEREAGEMRLRRGFAVREGERVAVVDDVVTTGGSLQEVLALVAPGELVAVGGLLDRSGALDLPFEITALARLDAPSWEAQGCPLCARGVPLVAPGSRHLPSPAAS